MHHKNGAWLVGTLALAGLLAATSPVDAALIVNGGFEATEAPFGWTTTGSPVTLTKTEDGDGDPVNEVHSGNQAAEIKGDATISQVVDLPAAQIGQTATVEFWWVNSEITARGTGWTLTVYDYGSGSRGSQIAQTSNGAISRQTTYLFKELDFIPTSTAIELVFDHTRDDKNQRGVLIDDVSLTNIVPEPGTLALLAIGGLGALARRRRA